ncbi:hypothetical protein CARUB_v10026236mg [Capsella rubella]|uniref:Wbp11/ELF5/Saf1 N-terminal domain-containing protein n=1 Tax=Capsella rubella TaxID=81985 RepID=R0EWH1_9BRAS|nr:formin-like protein 3 [Capsella rubella]EOA13211.1 hypothetical protein CARUB_v10026236mg [Capsella rubella]
MKTTKGGKVMNPTDAYRKEQRKREIKRNKKERQKVREVGILKKDPEQIKEQIRKLDMSKAEGALDKARKHKKRQLEDTLKMVVKKRKEYDEKKKEQGEATASVMFSHLPPQRRTTGEEDLKPEDSVYYHPTLNPTGAPPPGKPPMYNSSIGPSISSDGASSSGAALSSITELDDSVLVAPPPLPPLPPLPDGNNTLSASLPPPPPLPPTTGLTLPHAPFPPPPPGPPPKEQDFVRPPLPPAPPGLVGNEGDGRFPESSDVTLNNGKNADITTVPPPPPPGLPSGPPSNESESGPSESNASSFQNANLSKMVAPPPPPPIHQQHQSTFAGAAAPLTNFQTDAHLLPGMLRFPPQPSPLDMHPPHPGMLGGHLIPRLPHGPPPGPPPMMRPPLPPGPPPSSFQDSQAMIRPYVPNKPSYVKSAAPTVVRRPLAQHTPELTSMVPASVRVRRETVAVTKPKPKTSTGTSLGFTPRAVASAAPVKIESAKTSAASKPPSIDDSYTAFLEDMKALGALDG